MPAAVKHSPWSLRNDGQCMGSCEGIVIVQSFSRVSLFATPWTDCSTPGFPVLHYFLESFTISWSLHKLTSMELVMPSNHLLLCHPLLLLLSVFPSIRIFSNESALHVTWPKYWSFSFSISLSNEYLGLISFRTDWLGLSRVFSRTTVQKR